jgi:hypothetical protein
VVTDGKHHRELAATVEEHTKKGRPPETSRAGRRSAAERLAAAGIEVVGFKETRGEAQKPHESRDKKSEGANSCTPTKGKNIMEHSEQTTGDVGKVTGAAVFEAIQRGGTITISAKPPLREYADFAAKVVFTSVVGLGLAWGVKKIWNAGRTEDFGGEA